MGDSDSAARKTTVKDLHKGADKNSDSDDNSRETSDEDVLPKSPDKAVKRGRTKSVNHVLGKEALREKRSGRK